MFPQRSPPCLLTVVNGLGEGSGFQVPSSNPATFAVPRQERCKRLCRSISQGSVVLGKESESTWLPNIIKWTFKLVVSRNKNVWIFFFFFLGLCGTTSSMIPACQMAHAIACFRQQEF